LSNFPAPSHSRPGWGEGFPLEIETSADDLRAKARSFSRGDARPACPDRSATL